MVVLKGERIRTRRSVRRGEESAAVDHGDDDLAYSTRSFHYHQRCCSLQVAATIFPDSTLNAGAAADGSFGSGVLVVSIVPTSSSFLPTCSLSAVGLAISR